MTKIYKSALLFAVLASSFAIPAMAVEVTDGELVFDVVGSEATLVAWFPTDYENINTDIVVPNTVNYEGTEIPVTALRDEMFYSMGITSITLGENVKKLGKYCFMYCSNLTEVNLNEGLQEIGLQCFTYCSGVSEIALPSTVEVIGDMAFWSSGLSGEITVPASVKEIGVAPWRSLTEVTSINVADGNENYVSVDGVLYTKDMAKVITYPAGKTDTSFTLPETVKVITAQSMRNNPNLTTLVMPEGLEEIGDQALASSALTSIDLPSTVSIIGSAAFFNGRNLTTFTVADGNQWFRAQDNFLIEESTDKIVCALPVMGAVTIPEGIKEVGDYAFWSYPVTKVTFPSTMVKTGKASFADNEMLKTVEFNEGFEFVGEMCFQNCTGMTKVVLPSTLKVIDVQGFCSCGITEAILPEGFEVLKPLAFFSCPNLQNVYYPASIKECGNAVFASCSNLTDAVFAEGVTRVEDTMFNMDWALVNVTLPSTLESLAPYCFYGAAFPHIDLPEGLRIIEEAALYGTGLEELTLPNSVEEIGPFGLAWNFNMKSLKTGSGLKKIGHNGVHFTSVLSEVILNEGLEVIDDYGISACAALTTLTIPSTVTTIGEMAFYNNPFEKLVNLAVEPQVLQAEIVFRIDEDIYDMCELSVPAESVEAYKQAEYWKNFLVITGDAAGVENVSADQATVKAIYSLDGRQVENPAVGGVYIYKMSDGTAQKRVVK